VWQDKRLKDFGLCEAASSDKGRPRTEKTLRAKSNHTSLQLDIDIRTFAHSHFGHGRSSNHFLCVGDQKRQEEAEALCVVDHVRRHR
jgi:hypothetical protein